MRVNSNKNKQQSSTKPTIHNVFVLDSSASMVGNKYNAAVQGINTEIQVLKSQKGVNYTQSLVEFGSSDNIQKQIWFQDVQSINYFFGKNFYQNTALNDAIGFTITEVMKQIKEGDKVLLKIFTDGEENDSEKYSSSDIESLIKIAETKGFTITFEGTEWDTKAAVRLYGISQSNTHVHDNTAEGISKGVEARIGATLAYSKSVLRGENVTFNFYSKSVNK